MSPPPVRLPALVEPGPPLSPAAARRYARHLVLEELGPLGQRRLANARVLCVGAGGLGSPVLLYLAAAGVGTLGVVDFDVVEESNLARQVIHGQSDLGRAKVESARDRVLEVNPLVSVELHPQRLVAANALQLVSAYDLVVDGTDTFAARYLVNDACALAGKPYVWGSVNRFQGQASVFWAGHGPQYRDLHPQPPPAGSVPSCADGGVLGVVCAAIGSVLATEAVKLITGIGRLLLGRVLVYDALEMSYRTVELRVDPDAPPVGELEADPGAGHAPANGAASRARAAQALVDPGRLAAMRAADRPPLLLDVRTAAEHREYSLAGSVLVPLAELPDRVGELARNRDVVVLCESGTRSRQAVLVLAEAGVVAQDLEGGLLAWRAQGYG